MHPSQRLFLVLAFACSRLVAAPPPIPTTPAQEPPHPAAVPLWRDGAPGSEARKNEPEQVAWRQEPDVVFPVLFNIHNPSVVPFLPPADKATGAAVIIAPGGGHMFLTIDREGYDLAKWLAARGVAAFVLKYRLARDQAGNSPYKTTVEPVADGQRSVRLVRSRAAEWGLDPNRIGILGFSAGGTPVFAAATHFDAGNPAATDPVERVSSRPDFQGLIYTEVPRGEWVVPKDTPPAFIVVAFDDTPKAVPLVDVFLKYKAANVPTEVHIYNSGGHGFGVRTDRPELPVSTWPDRFCDWLGAVGMLRKS
jgi:endo-1,4-beta-xylanase